MSNASVQPKGKRGRKPIDIGKYELQDVINIVEELHPNGKFDNRSQLWDAVAQSGYWTTRSKSKPPLTVSPQTVMVLAKKHNLTIATPVGKRGRQKGCAPVSNGGRKRKVAPPEVAAALRKAFPLTMAKSPKVIENVINGSLKAKIKAKCIECSNEQKIEVRKCELIGCPLWTVRPYRNKK